jgi:hypothetical protein
MSSFNAREARRSDAIALSIVATAPSSSPRADKRSMLVWPRSCRRLRSWSTKPGVNGTLTVAGGWCRGRRTRRGK